MLALFIAFIIPPIILGSLRLEKLEKIGGITSSVILLLLFIVWCKG